MTFETAFQNVSTIYQDGAETYHDTKLAENDRRIMVARMLGLDTSKLESKHEDLLREKKEYIEKTNCQLKDAYNAARELVQSLLDSEEMYVTQELRTNLQVVTIIGKILTTAGYFEVTVRDCGRCTDTETSQGNIRVTLLQNVRPKQEA